MIFEKNGKRISITDPAHIDLYRAKKWNPVQEEQKQEDTGDKGKDKK